ncbi:MAG: SPOR domain-containing protein [Alphaproteobacteria bacterium]
MRGEDFPTYGESTEELPDAEPEPRRRWFRFALMAVSIGGLAGVGWYAYSEGTRIDPHSVAPLVKADKAPIKVAPTDPGGVKVPNSSAEIYTKLDADEKTQPIPKVDPYLPAQTAKDNKKIEQFLPAPGKDKAKAKVAAPMAVADSPEKADVGDVLKPVTPEGDRLARAKEPPAKPLPALEKKPDEAKKPVPKTVATKPATQPPVKLQAPPRVTTADLIGPYRVQLGAFNSPGAASRQWQSLVARHPDVLGDLNMIIEKVIQDKAEVFRLQAGPLRSPDAVKTLCTQLEKRKIGCILVKA